MARGWNPWTRRIPFDKKRIIERLLYWAQQYRERGNSGDEKRPAG